MDARKSRERLLGPALRTQPDRRLVALARGGSEPAQEEIVRRYRADLVRYAGSIVGTAAAEDAVQEALAKGIAALGRAGEELRLRPWLYAIVRNTALNHRRDAGPATERLDESYDGVEQPPQVLERRERVRSLVGGLRRLPGQQREALVKRELEGRSHEEIGAALGVSSGAARQLIFRARESLRVGFGSLLPMPLLRWLAENGGDGAVGAAAGAGGGALAAKAAVAVFAAGAAVTAGVAIDHGGRGRPGEPAAAKAAARPAVAAPGNGAGSSAGAQPEPVMATPSSGHDEPATEDSWGHRGGSSSEPGPGEQRGLGGGDDGRGSSESSGPGSGGGDSEDGGRSDRSGRGGPGSSSGDDNPSGSPHSGSDGGGSGRDRDGGDSRGASGSGGGDSSGVDGGSGTSGSSGSATNGGGADGGAGASDGGSSSGSGSGGGSSGGGHDGGDAAVIAPAPSPTPAPAAESESSGSGSGPSGSGDLSSETSRDLSGGAVSQGSDGPN